MTFRQKLKYAAALPVLAVGSAHAALPTGVTEAIETAGDDGVTLATAVLVAIIGIFAIKLLRRGL